MQKLTKILFESWAKKHDWLRVGEVATPSGLQHSFLTPSGALMVAMYDLKGNLTGFGQPTPAPQQPPPPFGFRPGR